MKLLPRLRELVVEGGGDPDDIVLRTVEMPEASEAAWFLGSPTVRIHGGDVEPGAGDRDDFGLKCRIYRQMKARRRLLRRIGSGSLSPRAPEGNSQTRRSSVSGRVVDVDGVVRSPLPVKAAQVLI